VVAALAAQVRTLSAQLRRSLTWDRGRELAAHRVFSVATDVAVSFCDPQSPWQRGSCENTNGLLRQYFPRKTDLSVSSQDDLDAVAARLNGRPRKTLAYETPADDVAARVASTASTHRSLLEDLALLTEDPVLASQAPELLALVGGQALTLA